MQDTWSPSLRRTKYLGRDGLGCFLSGDYRRDECEAGMLGYMRSMTPQHWNKKIGDADGSRPCSKFEVDLTYSRSCANTLMSDTYSSRHVRRSVRNSNYYLSFIIEVPIAPPIGIIRRLTILSDRSKPHSGGVCRVIPMTATGQFLAKSLSPSA